MLKAIKLFFEQNISPASPADNEHRLKLATAALYIEMMRQDGENKAEEVAAIKNVLQTRFKLNETETDELFTLAREEVRQAIDLFQFTSLIHKHYSPAEKIKIIENLWAVAFADKVLDPHEEHLIRRIADLLYVSHGELMRTKHRMQK